MAVSTNSDLVNEMKKPTRMHPKKFVLWLFMVSIVMIFASLTSAYIVRQAEGNWELFELPSIFYYSSAIIFLSSVAMHWALACARNNNIPTLRLAISITTVLGLTFLIMQYLGWQELQSMGIFFEGNVSGAFLYVLTGVHAAHLVTGVIFLVIMLVAAFQYKVHSKQMLKLEMCATYWHFLDGLWIYLFFFLLFNM
ncbi:MAG: cytochrome c oxidase subunit 3 [Flammeovirgaceae bacterium]